jgi:hypothetical protein
MKARKTVQLVVKGKQLKQFKNNKLYALRPYCLHFKKGRCEKLVLNFEEEENESV